MPTWPKQDPIVHRTGAVEYPLPGVEIPANTVEGFDPWIRQYWGIFGESVTARLAQRWESASEPEVVGLRDYLLTFVPRSIVVHAGRAWLAITDPHLDSAEGTSAGEAWFLAPPPASGLLSEKITALGLGQVRGLTEFASSFSGMHENIPNYSGFFWPVHEWYRLKDLADEWIMPTEPGDWVDSIPFFASLNGDHLLLSATGATGWWLHDENEVVPLKQAFLEFVRYYQGYITQRYPFSSWEPEPD